MNSEEPQFGLPAAAPLALRTPRVLVPTGTAGVRRVQPGHPKPPGPQPPEPTLDPAPARLLDLGAAPRKGEHRRGPGWGGGVGGACLGAARALAPRARGGASGATDLAVSSEPGSRPRAARSSSRAFATRGSAACAPQGEFGPGLCSESATPGGPLRGPSPWRPGPACAPAPVSPPRSSFPGSLGLHGVSRPRLDPGGHARAPSACEAPRIPNPNSWSRPSP